MKANLIVKNFGPIKDAELDLRNVNVFIGPQASGKSTLAKLFTICKKPLNNIEDLEKTSLQNIFNYEKSEIDFRVLNFKNALKELNIHNMLNSNSLIEFESEIYYFKFNNNKITFKQKFKSDFLKLKGLIDSNNLDESNSLVQKFAENFERLKVLIFLEIYELKYKNSISDADFKVDQFVKKYSEFKIVETIFNLDELRLILKVIDLKCISLLHINTNYIPAERLLIPILKGATFGLQSNNVSIPKHILNFAAEYEKKSNSLQELDLSFIKNDLRYKILNGEERIYFSPRKSVLLSESSTGIQSLIPLIIPISSENSDSVSNNSFVIEEPEMNLYPEAQYDLIKFVESKRLDGLLDSTSTHTYTTHSPYILASFNNLLYAYRKSLTLNKDKVKLDKMNEIIPRENWLNPDSFNAYTIIDGTAKQIFNRKIGLIDDNIIDSVTEKINDDFDQILAI